MKFTSQTIVRDLREIITRFLKVLCRCKGQKKYQIWERNPLSVDLWTKEVFIQKLEYVHYNPVAAGLCTYPEEYKYSSAKFYEAGVDEFEFLTHWVA